jgi:hypothetical protein
MGRDTGRSGGEQGGATVSCFHHLQHDHAFACAEVILEMVRHLMREECHREAHDAFYEAIMCCLQHYELSCERRPRRILPSRN